MEEPRQINPSVLVIVIILSVVFIFSGLLHILARCLGRRRQRRAQDHAAAIYPTARLQQLFSLPDAGVERAVIDALPVFLYGSIRGLKDSADCAVCLGEFRDEHKLRLLPRCKHAFHVRCIDAWLQGNSTCPLCRRSLLPEAEPAPASPENPSPTDQADEVEKTVRVELGKVHSFDSRRGSGAALIGTTSSRFPRSFSMSEYECVVEPTHRSARSEDVDLATRDLAWVYSPLRVQLGHREERHVVEVISTAPSISSRLLDPAPDVEDVVVSIDDGESSKESPPLKKSASLSWLRCDSGVSLSVKKLAPSRRLDPASVVMQPEKVAIDVDNGGESFGLLPSLKKSASLSWLRCDSGLSTSAKKLAPSMSLRPLDSAFEMVQPEKVAIDIVDGENSGLLPCLKKSASLDWSRCDSGLSPSLKKSASLSWSRGRSSKVYYAPELV